MSNELDLEAALKWAQLHPDGRLIATEVLRLRSVLLSQGAALARMRDIAKSMETKWSGSPHSSDMLRFFDLRDEILAVSPTHYEEYVKALESVAQDAHNFWKHAEGPAQKSSIKWNELLSKMFAAVARLDQLRGGKS